MSVPIERFPSLDGLESLAHGFLLRAPGVRVGVEREEALANLAPTFRAGICELGFSPAQVATCEQVHGGKVAKVETAPGIDAPLAGVDGLITDRQGICLGIYVADCCAVYIADRHGRAIGLVHSGKKGTEFGIAPNAINMLRHEYGIPVEDLTVQLSPCIRPPAYEIDFAAQIRKDVLAAGVPEEQVFDAGVCTSGDLGRYYSYRVEKGKTGRMLALMGLEG